MINKNFSDQFDKQGAIDFLKKVDSLNCLSSKWSDFSNEIYLKPKDTVAISSKPLTAALFFDWVWDAHQTVPGISFFKGTLQERIFQVGLGLLELERRGIDVGINSREAFAFLGLANLYSPLSIFAPYDPFDKLFKIICDAIYNEHRIPIKPIYSKAKSIPNLYKEGDRFFIFSVIKNIEIVSEEDLEIEQVVEFRKDKEAKKKLRRFLHWFDKKMVGKSQSFIEDEIFLKLEDYKWSLKKHGIKVISGSFSALLDIKNLLGAAISSYSLYEIIHNPKFSFLLGSSIMIGNTIFKMVDNLMQLQDIKVGPGSEIAYILDIQKLGKKTSNQQF